MNIVKELRKKAGIQQKELAIIAGVSPPTVSEWESNKKDPSGERLKKLAEYFGVDEIVILGIGVSKIGEKSDDQPQTVEARVLGHGADKMPAEDRQRLLTMVKLIFPQYADYFKKER